MHPKFEYAIVKLLYDKIILWKMELKKSKYILNSHMTMLRCSTIFIEVIDYWIIQHYFMPTYIWHTLYIQCSIMLHTYCEYSKWVGLGFYFTSTRIVFRENPRLAVIIL